MTQPHEWLTQPGGIAEQLIRLRETAGLTGKDLATAVGWAPSKVSRIEHGKQTPTAADIDTWVRACNANAATEQELLHLLEDVQITHRDWRRRMRLGQAAAQSDYVDLVQTSTVFRHFETVYIPGPLQTPEYARRILIESARLHHVEVDDLDESVRQRMLRQQWLHDPTKRFEFLLAEPVLRWQLCPADVMRDQLDRLQTVIGLTTIRFGILPLGVELATAPQNSFAMYDDLVLVETFVGESIQGADDAAKYADVMELLWAEAVTGPAARRLIVSAANALQPDPT